MSGPTFYRQTLQELLFHVLLLCIAVLLAWLSLRYAWHWDWTENRRNSLAPESTALLEQLETPLTMTSFAPDNPQLRRRILRLLERYQRTRPERIQIRFVDPELHPDRARDAGVELAGELVLGYQGRSERLQTLSGGVALDMHVGEHEARVAARAFTRLAGTAGDQETGGQSEGGRQRRPSVQRSHRRPS